MWSLYFYWPARTGNSSAISPTLRLKYLRSWLSHYSVVAQGRRLGITESCLVLTIAHLGISSSHTLFFKVVFRAYYLTVTHQLSSGLGIMPLQLLNLGVILPRFIFLLFITRTPRGVYGVLHIVRHLTRCPTPQTLRSLTRHQ
jgi:hypothetical protein